MARELELSTTECVKVISKFLMKNHRYFGTIFNYEGADYVKSINKEVLEINEMLEAIRDDDEEDLVKLKLLEEKLESISLIEILNHDELEDETPILK